MKKLILAAALLCSAAMPVSAYEVIGDLANLAGMYAAMEYYLGHGELECAHAMAASMIS
jgi:hypothetical protein